MTTSLETHTLPADGFVDYKYVVLPHVFLAGHVDHGGGDPAAQPGGRSPLQPGLHDDWPGLQRRQLHHRPRPRRHGADRSMTASRSAFRRARWSACRSTTRRPASRRRTGMSVGFSFPRDVRPASSSTTSRCTTVAVRHSAGSRRPRGDASPHADRRRHAASGCSRTCTSAGRT